MENLRYGQSASGKTPYTSVGLHPWFLEESSLDAAIKWLETQASAPGVLAIGETGLDKVCDTPWTLQETAFRHGIALSESLQKPLIIHCVRAYNEVIYLKKQVKPAQPWIFHGFNKHPDTAQMLLREGCFLSFGAALLQTGSHSAAALQMTPDERFFLETDDAEGLGITRIYEKAAAIRGISVDELAALLEKNVRTLLL
jgi:TatD DNase family protein